MSLFFTVFFLLYGLVHLYVFLKARHAYNLKVITGIPVAVFMLGMMFTPVIVRLTEKAGHEHFARFMAYTGYTWMAFLFLFLSISICIDFCRLCLYAAGRICRKNLSSVIHAYKYFFVVPLICSLAVVAYGYYEAGQIKTEKIVIKTPKIPENIGKLKIVQITDVHLGLIVQKGRLEPIITEIRKLNPDLLVSTGDLVDGQINQLNGLTEPLKEINPLYGKFAIMGNHEFYAGIETSVYFLKKAGFTVLRGKGVTVGGVINIGGVDDIAGRPYNYVAIPEKELLSGFPKGLFTLLLKHRPVVDPAAIGLFDLQLSGHTHKGQIFPFRFVTKVFFPMYNGYFKLSETSHLYVSRGSGTWGPPVRFLTPPEITVIELVHEPK